MILSVFTAAIESLCKFTMQLRREMANMNKKLSGHILDVQKKFEQLEYQRLCSNQAHYMNCPGKIKIPALFQPVKGIRNLKHFYD